MNVSSIESISAYIAASKAVNENPVAFSESSFNVMNNLDRVAFDAKTASGVSEIAMATDAAMNIVQKAMAAYVANMTTAVSM